MFLTLTLVLASVTIHTFKKPPIVAQRVAYVQKLLVKRGFTREQAGTITADPKLQMPMKPVEEERTTWANLKEKFLSPDFVGKGMAFLQEQAVGLQQIETTSHVPSQTLISLTGIESELGSNQGKYEAYKLLWLRTMTSSRDWHWQAKNFAALAEYCRDSGKNCFEIKGSRDGAVGWTQIMPTNIKKYGMDIDGCGIVDLDNPARPLDALATAANFLQAYWQKSWKLALTKYYGSSHGYPDTVLAYAHSLGLDLSQDPGRRKPARRRAKTTAKKIGTKRPRVSYNSGSSFFCCTNKLLLLFRKKLAWPPRHA
jgi:membrane-bound lytic murein transglycosylase B